MKTYNKIHFRISIISITLFIFLLLPEIKLYPQELTLVENIKLRSTENPGTNPGASVGEIITADGKIFLYSPEGLLVYDLSNNPASFSSIDFPGNYGKFNPVYSNAKTNGDGLNLINDLHSHGSEAYMESIYDVEFNETNDYFFIAQKKHLEVWQVGPNPNTLTLINTIHTLAGKCGQLLYIHDDAGPINKIVALPFRLPFEGEGGEFEPPMEDIIKFYVIDVNNPFDVDSVPAPSKRIMDGVFSSGNDDLIFCYSPDFYIQEYYTVDPESDVAFYHFDGDNFIFFGSLVTNGYPQYNGSTQVMNRPLKMFVNDNNSIILGKIHEVRKLIKTGMSYTSSQIMAGESNHFGKTVEVGLKDYILDPTLNGLAVYNETNSNVSYIRTAFPVYNICANLRNGNLYFSNRLASENSGFYIYSPGSGTMFNINEDINASNHFTKPIGDLVYNPFNGHFLVSENAPNEINNQVHFKVYDGDDNSLVDSKVIGGQYAKEMFISPQGWLYIMYNMHEGLEPKILICKAEDYSDPTVIDLSFVPDPSDPFIYYIANFLYNPRDRMVYITISPNDTVMDPYNPVADSMCDYKSPSPMNQPNASLMKFFGNQMIGNYNLLSYPGEIICPDAEVPDMTSDYQGLMFIKTNELFIYNYISSIAQQTIAHKFNDITYSAYYDKIYGISDEAVNEEPENEFNQQINIYQINPDGSTELKFEYPGQAAAFFSNPYDTLLYLFVKIDNVKLGDTPSGLLQLNPTNPDPEDEHLIVKDSVQLINTDFFVDLDHYNDYGFHFYNIITPYIDRYSNHIYLPNGGHSNVSVVNFKAEEPYMLGSGIKWLSFPRLKRTGDDREPAPDVLDRIKVPPNYYTGKMSNIVFNSTGIEEINYINNAWNPDPGGLYKVHSSLGYKIENLSPESERFIILEGDVWPSDEYITIYPRYENWIGYWLSESQSPFDAIPQDILDELISIKGQYWTCGKYWSNPGDGGGQGEPSYWLCACQQGRVTLNYGDMAILKTMAVSGNPSDFQWQRYGNPPMQEPKPEPEYYTFTEQDDYTPYFIELDTTELPLEIAAFVNDTCVGATKVLLEDTLVLIPGYTNGLSGEITFEEYFGPLKSQHGRNSEYLVYDDRTGYKEKRTIHTGEMKEYYLISFKGSDDKMQGDENEAWIRCVPNPVAKNCEIHYYLPQSGSVDISIFDLFGRKINTIYQGYSANGEFSIRNSFYNGAGGHLPGGVFYMVLQTDGQTTGTKVILIK